jgi:signal transduction histidine kinase
MFGPKPAETPVETAAGVAGRAPAGRRLARGLRHRFDPRSGYREVWDPNGRRASMARTAFYLYLAGGTLGFASLALPGGTTDEETAIVEAASIAYALAALYLVGFDRLPAWVYQVTTVCATAVITWATYVGGQTASAYPLFYLWVVLYALYFFPWREAAAHSAFVALAYGVVVYGADRTFSSAYALMTAGTIFVVGVMALLIKARLEGLLARLDRSNKALAHQNERLRELDRQKDELVSVVSHELKTPLTSIRGYLDLVLEEADALPGEYRTFLDVVDRNVDRLLHVLADLLFLAQVDEKRLALAIQHVDLAALVENCARSYRPLAEKKGVELECAVNALGSVAADEVRLAQVVDNLLSNAVKFTPPRGRVDVAALRRDGRAVVEVRDSGMGIPESEQSRVFERFFRGSNADEAAPSGTGLGLPIAKAVVDAHGGELTLESEEGVGTTARIVLPLGDPAVAAADEPRIGVAV